MSARGADATAPAGWPALPEALASIAVRPGEACYPRLSGTYMRAGSPALILRARDEADVRGAVSYAAEVRAATGGATGGVAGGSAEVSGEEPADGRVPVSVRSGGHGISGSGTNAGGLILDLGGLDGIEIASGDASRVIAQPGARWGRLAAALAPHDRALTSGNIGGTGIGGLATAGGIGYFARSQGLTIDHVRRVRLVTADGRARWVDAETEPELFWAVRGGGTQVGIAVAVELAPPRIGSAAAGAAIVHQEVQYLVEDPRAFVRDWGEWIGGAPREAESVLMLQSAGEGRIFVQAQNVWSGDDLDRARGTLEGALRLARVLDQGARMMSYAQLVPISGPPQTRSHPLEMTAALVDRADGDLGGALAESLAHRATLLAELRALGGAVSDVPEGATAWAGRHQEAFVSTWVNPLGARAAAESAAPIDALATGGYAAYTTEVSAAQAERVWPGETGRRLRAAAEAADPEGLFDRGLTARIAGQ